jgi:hypothetical protein
MVFVKSADGLPCRFPARRDLDAGLQPPPDMDQACGEIAVARISKAGWGERLPRGQRVLDGLPGVRVGGPLKTLFRDSETVSMEMRVLNVALIP